MVGLADCAGSSKVYIKSKIESVILALIGHTPDGLPDWQSACTVCRQRGDNTPQNDLRKGGIISFGNRVVMCAPRQVGSATHMA